MKKICLLLAICLLSVASAYGRQKTEIEKNVAPFSVMNIVGGLNVVFEQGGAYQVRLVGDADDVSAVDVKVVDGSLNLQTKNIKAQSFGDVYVEMTDDPKVANAVVYVTAPDVKTFNLVGLGTLRAEKLSSKSVVFNLAGSGQVDVKHLSAGNASFNLAGMGNMNLDNLKVKSVVLNMSGSGCLKANIVETSNLSCNSIGTGEINVSGTTEKYSKSTINGGTISDSLLKYKQKKESIVGNSVIYNGTAGSVFSDGKRPHVVDGIVVNP